MINWIVVMKIQPSSQVGRHWDLNLGPPECESHALPWSHLAQLVFLVMICIINK